MRSAYIWRKKTLAGLFPKSRCNSGLIKMNFWHWIEHLFAWNKGNVYSWYETQIPDFTQKLMIGFKCSKCGIISQIHEKERSRTYQGIAEGMTEQWG